MPRPTLLGAALAAALLAPASGLAADQPPAQRGPGAAASAAAAKDVVTRGEFIRRVAMADLFEVKVAALAMERGRSGNVKGFAMMLATDHETSLDKLREAVGDQEVVPDALDAAHESRLEALRNTPDERFDHAFIAGQIEAHRQAIALLQNYADNGAVPALRTFARNALSPNRHHLEIAQRIANVDKEWKGN